MSYNGLTNLGVEYLTRMVAQNKPVTFTKIKVGNGSIPVSQTGNSTTNLYSLKKEVEILSKEQVENSIKLQILLNNLDLEEGFYVKELGVYVQDGREEKLYWYINKDNPSYLPDKNTPSTHRYNLFLEVSNIETNIINFTGQGLLADKQFVKDQITQAFTTFEEDYNETITNLNTEIKKKFTQGTVPNSLNSAEKIIQALQGNGGLKFDENLLYLNDAGTKKKGFYYLDKLKNGIFECLEQTTVTVNDSSKFKDISNKSNSDRLDNLSINYNNKLNKGAYTGDAQDLKDEVDGKVSKNGDTMTGTLEINMGSNNHIKLYYNGVNKGELFVEPESIALYNTASKKQLKMYDDGSTMYPALNLNTYSKDVVNAINELKETKVLYTASSPADGEKTLSESLRNFRAIQIEASFGGLESYKTPFILFTDTILYNDSITAHGDSEYIYDVFTYAGTARNNTRLVFRSNGLTFNEWIADKDFVARIIGIGRIRG